VVFKLKTDHVKTLFREREREREREKRVIFHCISLYLWSSQRINKINKDHKRGTRALKDQGEIKIIVNMWYGMKTSYMECTHIGQFGLQKVGTDGC
jgi:tryptophanyl-tRNA synthetase